MSQPPTPKIQFRNIPEGKGKLFTLSEDQAPSEALFGTRNCHSCVGLFLPRPTKNCAYVAHINAWVLTHDISNKPIYDRIATASEGDQIKNIVQTRLQSLFKTHNWVTSNIDLAEVLLICPGIDLGGSWKNSTGWYVVSAIKEFLGRLDGLRCEQSHHGFVYDPAEEEMMRLEDVDFRQEWFRTQSWKQKVNGEMVELTAVDEGEGLDDWDVEVGRRE